MRQDATVAVRRERLQDSAMRVAYRVPCDLEVFTLNEVSAIAKRHRGTLYKDIAAGRLKTRMIGSSRRVTRAELERYLGNETDER